MDTSDHSSQEQFVPSIERDQADDFSSTESVVFVNYIEQNEDYWTAVFMHESAVDSFDGPRDEAVKWAVAQPADHKWIFDAALACYVPLKDPQGS